MNKQKNYIDEMVDELWDKFKSPLGHSSIDNKFNSMFDLENFLKQKLNETKQHERERIIKLIISIISNFEYDLSKGGIFPRQVWEKCPRQVWEKDIIKKIKELK